MNTLAAYLTRLLLSRFLLILVCLLALLLSLDIMVNSKRLLAQGAEFTGFARYMLLRSPSLLSEIIKIATLLAGLLTFATLIRHGELTAIWNAGVSQFGLFLRLLPLAAVLGTLQFAVDDFAAPVGYDELRTWGVIREEDRDVSRLTEGVTWIHVGNDIVRVPTENIGDGRLSDFTIFQRDGHGDLLGRLDVAEARYSGDVWHLSDVTERAVAGGSAQHSARREWRISLDPQSLRNLSAHPRHLTFDQISRFAGGDGQGTWAPYLYQTWLYEKVSACLVPLLMLLLSAALGQQSQRSGRVELLFLGGVAIGFAFFIFNGVTLAMGEVGLLPPLMAAAVPLIALTAVAMSIIYWHELKKRPA